jgi:hypothetical protein
VLFISLTDRMIEVLKGKVASCLIHIDFPELVAEPHYIRCCYTHNFADVPLQPNISAR